MKMWVVSLMLVLSGGAVGCATLKEVGKKILEGLL